VCHNGSMNTSEAVRLYLAPRPDRYRGSRTGEPSEVDLWQAAEIAGEWRSKGPEATATIFYTLHVKHGHSQHEISRRTGVPTTTIARLIERRREEVAEGA
jgi:hypothetical protein